MNEYKIKEDNKTSISLPLAKEKENKNVKKIYNSETYIGEVLVYIGQGEDGYHKYIVKQDLNESKNSESNIADVVERYSLLQLQSFFTGELFNTWYRPDMTLFVERWVLEKGKMVDKFRILPDMKNTSKIWYEDFTSHHYDDFEEAVKVMLSIDVT